MKNSPVAQPAWIDGMYMKTRRDLYAELGVHTSHGSKNPRYVAVRDILEAGSGWFEGHFLSATEPETIKKAPCIREDRGSGPLLRGHITTEFPSWASL